MGTYSERHKDHEEPGTYIRISLHGLPGGNRYAHHDLVALRDIDAGEQAFEAAKQAAAVAVFDLHLPHG